MNQRNFVLNEVTEDCDYFVCFFFVSFSSGLNAMGKNIMYGASFVVWNVNVWVCYCFILFEYYSMELIGFEYK